MLSRKTCAVLFWTITLFMDNAHPLNIHRFSLDHNYYGKKLTGHKLQIRSNVTLATCAKECYSETLCNSFNYQRSTLWCELNSVSKTSANSTDFEDDSTFVFSDLSDWPSQIVGGCGVKPCGLGQRCDFYIHGAVCKCSYPVQTCDMVKHISPLHGDGEYWMFSHILQRNIKVYCHDMASDNPKEYITLPQGNTVFHHGFGYKPDRPLQLINFFKASINILDMTIVDNDVTFSDYREEDGPLYMMFGLGGTCVGCNPYGYFSINTTGTGLAIDPSVQITEAGYASHLRSAFRSEDGTQASATCCGHCSACTMTRPIKLTANDNEVLSADAAISVTCT